MAREMRQGGVVMPSRDRRTADMHNGSWRGVVKAGRGPRIAPPKPWPSDKPPGGKLPSKAPKADEES